MTREEQLRVLIDEWRASAVRGNPSRDQAFVYTLCANALEEALDYEADSAIHIEGE